jgi:ATP-dependent 26S proteasome regulatory subunit
LFFDEADSLLSKRVDMNESCATSINQNRNVLMQELDRFNGVVIMTTNLFGNYDPALLRRIAKHVEFKAPNRAMRKRLFEMHLPNLTRVEANLETIARNSLGLCGGDILNVCLNSIYEASATSNPDEWRISEGILNAQIASAKRAKSNHAGRGDDSRRHIGFNEHEERELEQ